MRSNTESLFFELLQIAIGNRQCLSTVPSNEEWQSLFQMSQKQSLVGIAFLGLQALPMEQRPLRALVLQWYSIAMQIQQRNKLTTEVCHQLVGSLEQDGFRSCIMKGQANHRYYSEGLCMLRSCGDVDIWVTPENEREKHPVKEVLNYFYGKGLVESLCYLHIEVKPVMSVPVEVHLRPSFLNSPLRNRYFQRLFACHDRCICMQNVDGTELPVMSVDYDAIFQLNHIYRHLIDEGIGLRQVLDYYMLLGKWKDEHRMSQEMLLYHISRLGMMRFTKALMYVLREVFSMPLGWMICEASVKDGRFLLNEIILAGNFGHYDSRLVQLDVHKGQTSYQIKRARRRIIRNMSFFASYPEEVFWEPITRIAHLFWRKYHLWKY